MYCGAESLFVPYVDPGLALAQCLRPPLFIREVSGGESSFKFVVYDVDYTRFEWAPARNSNV